MALAILTVATTPTVRPYLEPWDIEILRMNWPYYTAAAKATQLPGGPSILAAIHYREAGLHRGYYSYRRRKLIKNMGGPFMLDPGPADNPGEMRKRIRAWELRVARLYGVGGKTPTVQEHFGFSCLVAADFLKRKFRTGHGLEDAVWGYNGRAAWQAGPKFSAYVSSDPKLGTKLEVWYRRTDGTKVRYVDTRPGVMVLYREIENLVKAGQLQKGEK